MNYEKQFMQFFPKQEQLLSQFNSKKKPRNQSALPKQNMSLSQNKQQKTFNFALSKSSTSLQKKLS